MGIIYLTMQNNDVFKSKYAENVIEYIGNKYRDRLEFLWKKFPKNAVFRRKDTAKWYAALLIIPENKIGLAGEREVEIIDLRADPAKIAEMVDSRKIFPGYHMNKKHWITVCLDGSVEIEKIYKYIDDSYGLAIK